MDGKLMREGEGEGDKIDTRGHAASVLGMLGTEQDG